MLAESIGALAGILTTLAFLPQVIKAWRTRQTRDISLTMFVTFCLGVALWLVYGLMLNAWPLIAANGITLVLAGTILALKLRNG
ncbi:SemiSWEET transporter [Telmatospirillum sp. J64-1]|uniref:SemiSWEET transporter n=1 Tax=Telmatospirillum sp. J64-1 TaxID=2502183 RepID=UPI00115F2949|nr:SemiSWEET transporter [Telmatospirillum sp. J64-1]